MGIRKASGYTFVELLVVATLVLILASAIMPLARVTATRSREAELRRSLREIRTAIDKYKDAADLGQIGALDIKVGSEGYPPDLETLVEGVTVANDASGRKLKFLRRIPIDPLTNSTDWGFRAYQDRPWYLWVLIPHDLEAGKVLGTLVYGPKLVRVNGTYDDVNRLCSEISGRHAWAFVNVNIRPYYAEGSKSYGFEILEQLGWRAPAHVVVPMASGSLLTKIGKAIDEFTKLGLVETGGMTFGGVTIPTDRESRANIIAARIIAKENPGYTGPIPADAVTASASGLDPHISPANAEIQLARVAGARGATATAVRALIAAATEHPWLGFIGEARVNVLELNLALDRQFPKQ